MPRDVGNWTRDKLRILELYLAGYLQATTNTRERVYIDGFAGPGKNKLPSGELLDGSPLIALKARASNGTRFSRLFFIEQDESLAAELTDLIKEFDTDHRCQVIPGDINAVLPRLVRDELPQRSPAFVFLDTEGIDPRWSTITSIAPWQVEFFVNFPLGMAIKRNIDSQKTLEYFGTDECLPLLNSSASSSTGDLLKLYKRRFADLGFVYSPENDRLIRTRENHALYYLVLVSKNPAAERIMTWVFNQPDYTGQSRLNLP
jgi:three-Cys-motif partner protein